MFIQQCRQVNIVVVVDTIIYMGSKSTAARVDTALGLYGCDVAMDSYVVDRGLTQAQDGTRGPSSAAAAALSTSCNHNVQSSHGHGLVKRQESLEPVSFGAVSFEARPLSMFTAFAALDEKNLTCNGRADLCDLRYNQVTYAGTHNSAAYDLKYDCDTAVESCLKSTTYCVQQQQNCTKGWETRCTKMSNSCIDRLPKWLHWLCGAFSSVCESTEQFCLGWEQICTSSVQVCTLWGSACLDVVPQWLLPCLWENQPGHPIAQQLADGIRFLDLGTCLTVDNSSVVMCHGFGPQRAVGVSLDSVLSAILDFYLKNPTEIITIEFNEADGDAADMAIMSKIIVQKMLQYFTLPNGHQLLWSRNSSSEPWPTLREMVTKNQRIVVFMGSVYDPIPEPKPRWANQKDVWKHDGFRYTYDDTTPAELNASYYKWCDQGPKNDGSFIQWQQIDINMAIIVDDLWDEIKAGRMPQVCIEPLAIQTNSAFLEALANYCYDKWPYWFRVRVNNYWHGSVFKVTDQFNDRNVARVKAGDSITPY
ncbi:hypothetical protein BGW41_000009 [Actinomortierella wolfii]|nr:hypothetical protein BGW41_000009 [Actinomortierella wolfii]